MKKILRKVFVSFLLLITLGGISTPSVSALTEQNNYDIHFKQEEIDIINKGLTPENIQKIENMLEHVTPPTYRIEPRSPQTQAVKKAIKAVIKNRNKIVNLVGKYIGRDAAVSVGAALNTIMPVLRNLQYWSDLAYGTVEGQIKNALTASGMAETTASTIAYWIRLALEWVI
ncbi:TPA: hypothetical protein ACHVA2_001644 [Streptococcus suis]